MNRLIPVVSFALLLTQSCSFIDEQESGDDELETTGLQCEYGGLGLPGLTLGLGPIQAAYDLDTRRVSVSVGGQISLGLVSIGIEEEIVSEPTCFTVELIDRNLARRYLFALDSPREAVRMTGSGTITQIASSSRLIVDVTEMCNLYVYEREDDRPEVSRDCGELTRPFYVVQFGAFRSGGAPERIEQVDALGVDGLGFYLSDTWASTCPGHVVVWSPRFPTRAAAMEYFQLLPEGLAEAIDDDPFVRRVSNSATERGSCPGG